jgi:tetrahydrodipicolinate N-succinyltransferase
LYMWQWISACNNKNHGWWVKQTRGKNAMESTSYVQPHIRHIFSLFFESLKLKTAVLTTAFININASVHEVCVSS